MSGPTKTCIVDQDSGVLLDLLETGPRTDSIIEAEKHLAECPECAQELASLSRIDALLRRHPGAFHPDETELYRFVAAATDPERAISRHLAGCRDCRDRIDLLQEMLAMGSETPPEMPVMPPPLTIRLERIHGLRHQSRALRNAHEIMEQVRRWIGLPWRVPALAAGTVAAALIVVVMGQQMWTAVKQMERPSKEVASKAPGSPPLNAAREEARKSPPAVVSPRNEMHEKKEAPPKPGPPTQTHGPKDYKLGAGEPRALEEPLAKGDPHRRDQPVMGFARSPRPTATAPEPESAPRRTVIPGAEAPAKPRMSPATPAVPLQRDELIPEAPAPREAEARKKTESTHATRSPVESADTATLIPVRVEVTDKDGHPFPGLSYSVDPELAGEYSFSVKDTEEKDKVPVKTGAVLNGRVSESGGASARGYRIVIRVTPAGAAYDLEARLTEASTGKEKRVAVLSRVARDRAADAVASLVRTLLTQR